MFENFGTAIVQAVGFFGVFAFFVYQLLSESEKTIKKQLKSPKIKMNEIKMSTQKTKIKGLFARKIEPVKKEVKLKKKA